MLDHFRTRLSRVDERPVDQIDRDIEDELAAHLEQLQADLIESGLPPAAAQAQALSRFGDPRKHKRRCRDVALMERRMKTYTQIIVTAGCGLLVAAVTTSLWFNQQSANAAIGDMSTKMADLANAVGSRTGMPAAGGVSPQTAAVYVTGDVPNPGQFAMPAGGVSLRRMLAAAGVNEWEVNSVVVSRKGAGGTGAPTRIAVPGLYLREDESKDVALQADDLLTVVKNEDASNVIARTHKPAHIRGPRVGEVLFVNGDVPNPGQYAIPTNGISLRRMLAVAGVNESDINHVMVDRTASGGSGKLVVAGTDLREGKEDLVLENNDLVMVVKNEKTRKSADGGPPAVIDPVEAVEAVAPSALPRR